MRWRYTYPGQANQPLHMLIYSHCLRKAVGTGGGNTCISWLTFSPNGADLPFRWMDLPISPEFTARQDFALDTMCDFDILFETYCG